MKTTIFSLLVLLAVNALAGQTAVVNCKTKAIAKVVQSAQEVAAKEADKVAVEAAEQAAKTNAEAEVAAIVDAFKADAKQFKAITKLIELIQGKP